MRINLPLNLADFRNDRSGAAAIEIAFIAPIMILLALLGVDTANYVIATEQIEQAADTIAQMITTTSPSSPGSTTGTVSNIDLKFYHDSAALIFPGVLNDAARQQPSLAWAQDIKISVAGVQFTPTQFGCAPNCTYIATTMWNAGDNPRQCYIPFRNDSDTAVPSSTTLPSHVFGPNMIIVVDVLFTYHPMFASYFGVSLPIARSVFMTPRYVGTINYQASSTYPFNGVIGHTC
jgi:Flp pilus assembly pilin Flp